MEWQEMLGWVVLILLSVYGCAQAIRRLCLWLFRCRDCVLCCRLAVPQNRAAIAPLVRCLQSQTAWEDTADCRYTVLLLPDEPEDLPPEAEQLFRECPAVIPLRVSELPQMLRELMKD